MRSKFPILWMLLCCGGMSLQAQSYEQLDEAIETAMNRKDHEQAAHLIEQGLAKAKAGLPGQLKRYAGYLTDRSALAYRLADYKNAIKWGIQADTALGQMPPTPLAVTNLIRVSASLLEDEQIALADQHLQKAERILNNARMDDHAVLLSQVYRTMGYEYALLLDLSKAASYYQQAGALLKADGNYEGYVTILAELIPLLNRVRPDEASALIAEVRNIVATRLGGKHPILSTLLMNEATALAHKGQFQQADLLFDEAYTACLVEHNGRQSIRGATYSRTIGNYHQNVRNDHVKAETYLRRAIDALAGMQLTESSMILHCREDLAYLYMKTRQYDKAIPLITQTQAVAKVHLQRGFGMTSQQQKDRLLNVEGWGLIMTIPYTAYLMKQQPDTLMQQLSYNASLYINGLLLGDAQSVSRRIRQSKDPALKRLYEAWLAQKLVVANAPLTERAREATHVDELEEQLTRRSTIFRERSTDEADIHWQEVQAGLGTDQAAVSFVRYRIFPLKPSTDETSFGYAAMVIRPGYTYPRFVTLTNESQLRWLLQESETPSALYTGRGPRFGNITYGDSLYRAVWQPVEPLLQGVDRVYFSADGLLHRVAFAALPLPNTTAQTPIADRYLNGRYKLHQLFSTRQLAQGIRPFMYSANTSVTLLGDIAYAASAGSGRQAGATDRPDSVQTYLKSEIQRAGLQPFSPLTATGQEVRAIQRLLTGATALTAANAGEAQVRAMSGKAPAILHVATHGFYIPAKAGTKASTDEALMRSGLALAGANALWQPTNQANTSNDGLLTAYEVSDLDLSQTRLVVLSACETALGDLRGAEGVFGLQRAFRLAGAEKLLISLWPVDDARTQQLMVWFYTYLKAGQDARTAFRKAQAELQGLASDPTIWAAFVLIE